MELPSSYKSIMKSSSLKEMLDWPFDFNAVEPYLISSDWPIQLSHELNVIAEDGAGGAYTLLNGAAPAKSPVIFLSSEGQAGKVANSLDEFLAILIAIPYWRDLLKFSSNGKLAEMRKAAPFLEKELIEDEPEIESKKRVILESMELPSLSDPINSLFSAVLAGCEIEIKSEDGMDYSSLFNDFSVSDNRTWSTNVNEA
jgi:hypothetical protein